MYRLCFHSHSGMAGIAEDYPESGFDDADARRDARREVAARLREARNSTDCGEVSIVKRGERWEVSEPDDCALVPDSAGLLVLERLTYTCRECGSECGSRDAAAECCSYTESAGSSGRHVFPRSFADCRAILTDRKGRPMTERKIAHNTTLRAMVSVPRGTLLSRQTVERGRVTAYTVRLNETDIVTFLRNGTRVLHSGGWQTATTRNRWQACGINVGLGGGVACLTDSERGRVCYLDGCRVLRNGTVRGDGGSHADALRVRRRNLATSRSAWRWEGRQGGRGYAFGNAPEAQRQERKRIKRKAQRQQTGEDAAERREQEDVLLQADYRKGLELGARFAPDDTLSTAPDHGHGAYVLRLSRDGQKMRYGCARHTVRTWARSALALSRDNLGTTAPDAPAFGAFLRGVAHGILQTQRTARKVVSP